jgi:hypothetical protein
MPQLINKEIEVIVAFLSQQKSRPLKSRIECIEMALPKVASRRMSRRASDTEEAAQRNFDFEPFYKGITMLKFGKKGAPHEKIFKLSGNQRYITWRSGWFTSKFGKDSSGVSKLIGNTYILLLILSPNITIINL